MSRDGCFKGYAYPLGVPCRYGKVASRVTIDVDFFEFPHTNQANLQWKA